MLKAMQADPQDKLFVFQFPNLFPKFDSAVPVDFSAAEDVKPDVKPSMAQLRARKKNPPPPEGRIGTMVVMRSGKVKLVLGDDIVMNVGLTLDFLTMPVLMDPSLIDYSRDTLGLPSAACTPRCIYQVSSRAWRST